MTDWWYALDKYETELTAEFTAGDGYIRVDELPDDEKLPTYLLVDGEDDDSATVFSAYYLGEEDKVGITFARRLKYAMDRENANNVEIDLPIESTVTSTIAEELLNQYATTSIEDWTELVSASSVELDASVGLKNNIELDTNVTMTIANAQDHDAILLRVAQDGTGSRTLTFDFTVEWMGDETLMDGADEVTVYGFLKYDTDSYYGFKIGETQ